MENFIKIADVNVCLKACKLDGFSFRPGFVYGEDENGKFASSRWESGGYVYIYRQTPNGWKGAWEDIDESWAADKIKFVSKNGIGYFPPENMARISVLSASGEETNPFADSSTSGNGGGYFQPSGDVRLLTSNGVHIDVRFKDTSCGDFGTRKSWEIRSGMHEWGVQDCTMDACDEDQLHIDIVRMDIAEKIGVDLYVIMHVAESAVRDAAYR